MDELCNVEGCLYDAAFYPVLKVYTRQSDDAAEVKLEYPTCLGHTNILTVDDLLPGRSWDNLVRDGFVKNGLLPPLKEKTKLEWVSMQLKENDGEEARLPGNVHPGSPQTVEPDGPPDEGGADEGHLRDLWDEAE